MAEFENIIPSESSEGTIDKAPQPTHQPPIKAPNTAHGTLPVGIGMKGKEDTGFHRDENIHEIDVEKFKDDVNRGSVVMGTGGVDALINERAENQGFGQQLLNMAGQAIAGEIVGGTIEGFGYLGEIPKAIDYMSGSEREFGNFLTDLGQDIREGSQEYMPIYQRTDSDWHDSGWWAQNGVSVASSLSMLVPSMAATKALGMLGKGLSKGAGMLHNSLDVAAKLGKYGTWAAEGLSSAVVSRHMENAMEASGVFREKKEELLNTFNPKTGKLFTEQEAGDAAGEGASSTYNANWAMLLQDIPQYLALGKVFNPRTMQMEKAGALLAGKAESKLGKLGAGLAGFASEGAEESYQYYMSERGKLLSDRKAGLITPEEYDKKLGDKIGDKEMLTSAFWGGLGGTVFSAVGGATNNLFKSKERRDYEDNFAQAQGDFLKERGRAYAQMQQEVMKADQSGDPVKRQEALSTMSMNQALEALGNDSLDQHIEMLNNMQNMSKEEAEAFAAQTGTDINLDLLKQSAPQAIKQAQELRTSFLKHSNKYDTDTAIVLARNDHDVSKFSKRDKELAGQMQETKAKIHDIDKLSGHYTEMIDTKSELTALKETNKVHAKAIELGTYAEDKKNREELIKANEAKIESLAKKITHLKNTDQRDSDQKILDEKVSAGYESKKDELRSARIERALISDAIYLRNKENAYVKTESFQKEKAFQEKKRKVKTLSSKEGVAKARKDVEANPDLNTKQKEELYKDFDQREIDLDKEAETKAAQEARDTHAKKLEEEKRAKASSNTTTVPVISRTPVSDNLEDELANEEPDLDGQAHATEMAKKVIFSESSANAKVNSQVSSDAYKAWETNGKDKRPTNSQAGDNIQITVSREPYEGKTFQKERTEALALMERAVKGEELTNEQLSLLYNFLPLKVTVNSDPNNWAFLSAMSTAPSDPIARKGWENAWNNKDFPTRKAYISNMITNKKESHDSKVVVQYGGELQRDEATGGVIPENNIGDLMHIKANVVAKYNAEPKNAGKDFNNLSQKEQLTLIADEISINLMYSNEHGWLNSVSTKKAHANFQGTITMMPGVVGTDGNAVPLAGAIFLGVKKADGYNFPMKLNLSKPTEEEADLIIDLCNELVKAGNPNIKFKELSETLQNNIRTNFRNEGSALEGVFSEKVNPNIMELIGAFVYMDASTKGKTSEFRFTSEKKQNMIVFSVSGQKFTADSDRVAIKKFLMETKRKQFDISKWKNSASYRRYAISSGLINTDAKIDGPLFKGKTDVYISSPAERSVVQGLHELAVTNPAKLAVKERREFSKTSKAKSTTDGKVSIPYIDASGKYSNITRATEKLAREAVEEAYNNQESKTAVKTQTVIAKKANEQLIAADVLDSPESKARMIKIDTMHKKESELYKNFLIEASKVTGNAMAPEVADTIVSQHMNAKYTTEKAGNSFGKYINQLNTYTSSVILKGITDTFQHYKDPEMLEKVKSIYKGFERKILDEMAFFDTLKDVNAKAKQAATGQVAPIKPVVAQTPAQKVAAEPVKKTQMSTEELKALMEYKPTAEEGAPTHKEVEIQKDSKSKWKLTVDMETGEVLRDGKKFDVDKEVKLINKARLKSGFYKYKSVNIYDKSGKVKGTYAVVQGGEDAGNIINITKDSASNGALISENSPIGKKVIEGYRAKPVEIEKDFSKIHPLDMLGEIITAQDFQTKENITGKITDITPNKTKEGRFTMFLENGERVGWTVGTSNFTWVKGLAKKTTATNPSQVDFKKMLEGGLGEDVDTEALAQEQEDLDELENKINTIESINQAGHTEVNNAFSQQAAEGNTEIIVSLEKVINPLEITDEDFDDFETEQIDVNTNKTVDKNYTAIAKASENDVKIIDDNPFASGSGASFDMSMLINTIQSDIIEEDLNCGTKGYNPNEKSPF